MTLTIYSILYTYDRIHPIPPKPNNIHTCASSSLSTILLCAACSASICRARASSLSHSSGDSRTRRYGASCLLFYFRGWVVRCMYMIQEDRIGGTRRPQHVCMYICTHAPRKDLGPQGRVAAPGLEVEKEAPQHCLVLRGRNTVPCVKVCMDMCVRGVFRVGWDEMNDVRGAFTQYKPTNNTAIPPQDQPISINHVPPLRRRKQLSLNLPGQALRQALHLTYKRRHVPLADDCVYICVCIYI